MLRRRSTAILVLLAAPLLAHLTSGCEPFGDGSALPGDGGPLPREPELLPPEGAPDAGSWCVRAGSSIADRCFDFDEDGDVAAGWTSTQASSGGEVVRDTSRARSGPGALAVHAPSGAARARLLLDVSRSARPFVVELDFWPDQIGEPGSAQVMTIDQGPRALIVYLGRRSLFFEERDGATFAGQSTFNRDAITEQRWHHLRLVLAEGSAALEVDRRPTLVKTLGESWTAGPVTVGVGFGYINPSARGPWSFVYDNVLIGAR